MRLPHEIGIPNDGQTKDFSGSEYRTSKRYGTEELKKANMKKIVTPTKVIHMSGVQAEMTPNSIRNMFIAVGAQAIDAFSIEMKKPVKKTGAPGDAPVKTSRTFAYIEFATEDDAVLAMANFGSLKGFRLSFSKDEMAELKEGFVKKNMEIKTGDQASA